jgi:hypothetical protein
MCMGGGGVRCWEREKAQGDRYREQVERGAWRNKQTTPLFSVSKKNGCRKIR